MVLVCRDSTRGREALQAIAQESGNDSLGLLIADLSSMVAVRKLAADFQKDHDRLHVLVSNAGTFRTKRHVTAEGNELTLAVNYLSRFLLTNLLLDALKRSAPSRVIEVAGSSHARGEIDFADLQGEQGYDGTKANNQSKLANVLFTYELARRAEGSGVSINCLHPGAVATGLVDKDPDFPSLMKPLYKLFRPFFKSPLKGAETIIYLATEAELEAVSGQYFVNKERARSAAKSYDTGLSTRLWDVSQRLVELDRQV